MRRQTQTQAADGRIAAVGRRQYGVVTRSQLVDLGLSEHAIDRRLRLGRLHRLHPRVYAVGHRAVSQEALWLAAVLTCEPRAVLSHRSAAMLWGLLQREAARKIDVTTPRKTRPCAAVLRHCARLDANEMAVRRGIPVTSLHRTLLDVAISLRPEALTAALREAEYAHRPLLVGLEAYLDRRRGRRGVARVRACLDRLGDGPSGRTRSRLEDRFVALLGKTDLPRPDLNAVVDLGAMTVEADCLWRAQKVIVELDGMKAHGTRSAFQSDRVRDRRLQAAGWRVVRVTWAHLATPADLLADLRLLLVESASARA
jgi:hypothetical protein